MPPGGVVFERAALERCGGFDEAFPTMNDKELLARLAARGVGFRYVPGLILYHRDHGNARLSRQTITRCRMGEAILDRHTAELEASHAWTGFRRRQLAAEYFLLALAFFLAMGRGYVTSDLRALVFVGIFGGYTTMSTFGLETVALLAEGQLGWAAGNIFLNGGLCVVGAYLGRTVGMLLGGA